MLPTVKDLLIEIKDSSELIVDLAYSALLFDSESIAEEVLDLEEKIDDLSSQLSVVAILSARSIEDAESISPILKIASASCKIGSAAGDIALLVLKDFKLPKDIVNEILLESEETIVKVKVPENSKIANKTLNDIKLHTKTGMKIIAIKRELDWIFNPNRDTKILKGDVLVAKGDITSVPKFYKIVTGEEKEIPEESIRIKNKKLGKIVDLIINMKNLSELAVDLSYSALVYRNEEIAQEAIYLENKIDSMKFELEELILDASKDFEDKKTLIIFLNLANISEIIADSAREIAEIITEKLEIHPIIKEAMNETDEILTLAVVAEKSNLNGKTLGETKLETNTGMHVIAIKRGNEWIRKPTAKTKIYSGDLLIAKGTKEGEMLLKKLCGMSS